MKKPTREVDDAIKKLSKATRRLTPDQGIVGRRNARKEALVALRRVRAVIDTEYPVVHGKRKKGPETKDGKVRAWGARMVKRKYVIPKQRVSQLTEWCAEIGMKVERNPWVRRIDAQRYFPLWVVGAYDFPEMKRAKKDLHLRRAIEVRSMLLPEQDRPWRT